MKVFNPVRDKQNLCRQCYMSEMSKKRTLWTVFLSNNKGTGKTIKELAVLYRQQYPRVDTTCNQYKTADSCKAVSSCTFVTLKKSNRKKTTKAVRSAFCRNKTTSSSERCTICGNVKMITDWRRHGCDRCMALSDEELAPFDLKAGDYQTYKQGLRRKLYTHKQMEQQLGR